MLSYICVGIAVIVFIVGLVSKYVMKIAAVQPASFLLMAQILLLLSLNFIIYEALNKK